MIRLEKDDSDALARALRTNPVLLKIFRDWKARELEKLPFASDNVDKAQGRCLILFDVVKLFEDTIDKPTK